MSLNENLQRGQKVRLLNGTTGTINCQVNNFGFPLWEIHLSNGKTVTEARYRFDVVDDNDGTGHSRNESNVVQADHIPPEELLELFNDIENTESNPQEQVSHQTMSLTPQPPTPPPPVAPPRITTITKQRQRQFVPVDDESIENFVVEQENKGTAKKTLADMRTLTQFLVQKNENRNIQDIPPAELNKILSQFFFSVRKSDGTDYEPNSLRGMMCSFDRVLKRHDYGAEINRDVEFAKTREVLRAKQIQLKKIGKGNSTKKAESLSDEDINTLFETGQLGLSNPTALLHTIWFFNTIFFGMRGVTEHHQMRWGDVKLCNDSGNEYLEMNERNTKTRTGTNIKNNREVAQRAWKNEDPERCPVTAYKLYKSKRPTKYSNPDDPFYIQQNTNPEKSTLWFKSQPVGVNKLSKFMKTIAVNSGLLQNKENDHELADAQGTSAPERRLTNHSARRFMLQKLDDIGFEHNHIKQISGHRNIQSVTSYAKLSNKKHQEMSGSLLKTSTSTSTIDVDDHKTINNSQVNILTHQPRVVQTPTSSSLAANALFSGPIYGGTFNIYMNHSVTQKRKRPMIIESDSDSQSQ